MKIITLLGLFLDLLGVVILGVGEVTRGAAYLRHLRESYKDSFDYDVQHRPWYARPLLVLGAKLGSLKSSARSVPLRCAPALGRLSLRETRGPLWADVRHSTLPDLPRLQ